MIHIEKVILHSDQGHNLISTGSPEVAIKKLKKEHREKERLCKERFLVEYREGYIGLFDFTMINPNDEKSLDWPSSSTCRLSKNGVRSKG
ncbi:hypothetical protein ACFSCX_11765 [Bacillus salitolerans]|uniref:Uncharacterized protein n=1 Tax=Bacillus salitolerans TaxID=1437434 RepID=A0ABW4LR29_9BACI